MKLVLSSAAIIIAASSGVAAADGQRRLRHGVTSEDEAFVAHRGYRNHFNPGPGQHRTYSGRTIDGSTCFGNCGHGRSAHVSNKVNHPSHRTHSAHHYQTQKQQESAYKNWQHNHHPHNHGWPSAGDRDHCAWCDEDESKVLDNFLDDYDKKDIKVIANFLRSDAYEDYVESEDYN